MALLGLKTAGEVGLRSLLRTVDSTVVLRTACCSVGIVLPVYSTFEAIERNDQNEQEKWLTYWAAYGPFRLVDTCADKLLYW
uniref:HVA22-like protein n=1 Tax=Rhizophora mucronata TaxID=61149 RepID=A0A2P2KW06_RHIMU